LRRRNAVYAEEGPERGKARAPDKNDDCAALRTSLVEALIVGKPSLVNKTLGRERSSGKKVQEYVVGV